MLGDEVHVFPTLGLLVRNFRRNATQRHKDKVFEQVSCVDQDAQADRSYQRVVDAVYFLGIGIGPRK